MLPEILTHPKTLLIGNRRIMSFANNTTFVLWNRFMPGRSEIENRVGEELFSIQIYPENFDFDPNTLFEKWAAVAVSEFDTIPNGMETLTIPEGLYAVFLFKGKHTEAESFFRYVFADWLPSSEYELDTRPHFEILGKKYKHNDADSEEEVWIPIRMKH